MEDDKLNKFSKKLFENYKVEKISDGFTDRLMKQIENEKYAKKVASPIFSKKFVILFVTTFLSILAFGYFLDLSDAKVAEVEQVQVVKEIIPDFDFGQIFDFLHFNLELGFIVKLAIISIAFLLFFDFLSGKVMDLLIDARTKKES